MTYGAEGHTLKQNNRKHRITMNITIDQLRKAIPNATAQNCERYIEHLNVAMEVHHIDTPMRIAHFLAQLAWESGSLRYAEEIYSGIAYEGRKDLGNTEKGDGIRFKGRGLIQLTGRANYRAYGQAVGVDFCSLGHWRQLAEPRWAADSAAWFWETHGLNERADRDEFTNITRVINGSTKTVQKRLPCLRAAKLAFNLLKK